MILTAQQKLQNLADAMCDDIDALTDDEVITEALENGEDIDALVKRFNQMLDKCIQKAKQVDE